MTPPTLQHFVAETLGLELVQTYSSIYPGETLVIYVVDPRAGKVETLTKLLNKSLRAPEYSKKVQHSVWTVKDWVGAELVAGHYTSGCDPWELRWDGGASWRAVYSDAEEMIMQHYKPGYRHDPSPIRSGDVDKGPLCFVVAATSEYDTAAQRFVKPGYLPSGFMRLAYTRTGTFEWIDLSTSTDEPDWKRVADSRRQGV
ncbi:hypothetical protein GPECTOR_17g1000 [Gonium pectorale]|uniref:Uncharacterized protein n=1 Tax=Gonium pectorale TaxID=33097 RepID=A0A150GK21_GONPE|nr:hypothetical protein GPECTOR_17g1000 [Gonium pectorale]|eukprot:KXZ50127.1 hypothetical protein GPECTOR_17g1000 [Gonium pectorale]